MENNLGNVIPSDYVRNYTFDGNGNNFNNTNNATVTNGTYSNSSIGFQRQSLVWGASTTCTYASVTYTNSYIWIYASGSWTFTKNSGKVSATALTGTNGERYAMLKFFNRALTENEEQILKLEGLKKLGPSELPNYPKLLDGLVYYADFKGNAHNLVDGVAGTVTGATLTTDRFGNANSSYDFDGNDKIELGTGTNIKPASGVVITVGMWVRTSQVPAIYGMLWNGGYQNHVAWNSSGFIGLSNTGNIVLTGNGTNVIQTPLSYNDGLYHHIVVVVRSIGAKIYVDGELRVSGNITLNAGYSNIASGFGALTTDNLYYLTGVIDDGFVLNREPSASEVKQLYQLTSKDYIYPNKSYDLLSLRQGLVLDLNEQGKDLSGNGNHGTLVNAPVVVRQGRAKGLSYNGSNRYVNLGLNIFPSIINNCSFSCFVYLNSNSVNQSIFSNGNNGTGGNVGWQFGIKTDGVNNTYNFTKLGIINENTGITPVLGKWQHIVIVVSGYRGYLYINGLLIWTGSNTATISNNTQYTTIGAQRMDGSYQQYLNGNIINPRLVNRVLSAKEIQALYYSQASNYNF